MTLHSAQGPSGGSSNSEQSIYSTDQSARLLEALLQLPERLLSGSNVFVNGHMPVLLRELDDGSSLHCGVVPFRYLDDPRTGLPPTRKFPPLCFHSLDPASTACDHGGDHPRLTFSGPWTRRHSAMEFTSGFSADCPVAAIAQGRLPATSIAAASPELPVVGCGAGFAHRGLGFIFEVKITRVSRFL
jgi:hypothetical protein